MADVVKLRGQLLVIAIVWANHHYLLRYATEATPRLM